MSNPFDQFATDLSSALPHGGGAPPVDDNPFSFGTPAPADKPVMNSPLPTMGNLNGGYGGGYEQPPMYGGGPPPMYGGPGGGMGMGMGMAPPMNGGMGVMGGTPGGGAPFSSYGAPAAPSESDPYSSYGAPQQAPPTPNPYGGPHGPPPQQAPPMAPPTPNAYGAPPLVGAASATISDPYSSYGAPTSDPYGAPPQQQPAPSMASFGAPPSQQAPNPYGAPPSALVLHSAPTSTYGVPPPAGPPASDPFGGYGAPPPAAPPANDPYRGYGAPPPAGPPASDPFGGYGAPPPPTNDPYASAYGAPSSAPAPPTSDPFGGYGAPPPAPPTSDPFGGYGAPPPAGPPSHVATPGGYGAPPAGPPANDPFGGYGAPPPAGPPASDPFGGYGAPPPPQQHNPYGAPPPPAYGDPFGGSDGALVVSQQPSNPYGLPPQHMPPPQQAAVDPFSVFNQAPAPAPPQHQQPPPQQYVQQPPPGTSQALVPAHAPPPDNGDLWSDLGFDAPPVPSQAIVPAERPPHEEEKKDNGDLPPGGEYYDARIFTPTLGVMFFKPQELTDSLYLNTDRGVVDALGERPVVAFIVEGSSARSAGVELGHVLLKVNGVDVRNPKEASRLIKEGPRPLPLLFYVPNTEVVVAEGEHMVKYDTRETTAPNSAKDWKPKYVVIGGIIAQPWMINMYRSKSEYDIAVIETQARRPVSVKVKQFSLQGARIQNDWQGPQMVKYKNKLHPWKYIVVLPIARNPIKISSPNLASLKPVHEGIRRVLLAQQRGRGGGNPHTAAPVRGDDGYRPSEPTYAQAQPQPQPAYGGY